MLTKENIQAEAISTLEKDKRLILQWATGVGKGYTAVRAIQQLKPSSVLIVVAETAHKKNWAEEFKLAGGVDKLDTSITVECYASLKNYENTYWDLIIFDEAHHLGSEKRLDILSTLKANRVLVLSATLSDPDLLYCLKLTFGEFKCSVITIQQAIDNHLLPEPKIYLIPLNLDYLNKNQIIEETWGISAKRKTYECTMKERWNYIKNKKTLYPNVKLIIHCSAYEKYNYLTEQMDFWMKKFYTTRNEAFKAKALNYGSQRKILMGESKTEVVKRLLETLEGKKYICFCTNISQAEVLGGANAIHSEKKSSNQAIIDSFNEGSINSLFAVGMLQEGQNLKGIQAGVIVQLDGKERAFIQKFGRSMRAEDPIQYIFYYRYTQDEKWMKKVLEGIDPNFIKEYEIHN